MSASDKLFLIYMGLYALTLVPIVMTVRAFTATQGTRRYTKLHEKRWYWLGAIFVWLFPVSGLFMYFSAHITADTEPQMNSQAYVGLVMLVVSFLGLLVSYILTPFPGMQSNGTKPTDPSVDTDGTPGS